MYKFTPADIEQIVQRGTYIERIAWQLSVLQTEQVAPLSLVRHCTVGDGIVTFTVDEIKRLTALFDTEQKKGTAIKFVPASGLASRMFAHWQSAIAAGSFPEKTLNAAFLQSLPMYAFYPHLDNIFGTKKISQMAADNDIAGLLRMILSDNGLDYGNTPKALIAFHRYNSLARAPIEEHIVEATHYTRDANGICRLHFTVAEERIEKMQVFLNEILPHYEQKLNAKIMVELSTQSTATDTIAIEENGEPARDATGKLIFRAGGHGALLENLSRLKGNIIFIKNIDNVMHSSRLAETIKYKKVLAGYLIDLRGVAYAHLAALATHPTDANIEEIKFFCEQSLNHHLSAAFARGDKKQKIDALRFALNRPLRVCGMVKNDGEPGGAPLWVKESSGQESVQIVESFQVNQNDRGQKEIWNKATFFNPVDIVCSIRDAQGKIFNLEAFANKDAISITVKPEGSRSIKVLELPGLWNGAMARWNTVFVEVPLATFNPVKVVDDLLRASHQQIA